MGRCQKRITPVSHPHADLHQVRATKPKFTRRILPLGNIFFVVVYKPSLRVWNETADGADVLEPFVREHRKSTSGGLRHPVR